MLLEGNPMSSIIQRVVPPNIRSYIPFLYKHLRGRIETFENGTDEVRRRLSDERLAHIMLKAASTKSARAMGLGKCYEDYPYISKRELRANCKDFTTWSLLPRLIGETGGTSGSPLRVERSLLSSVFQAAIRDHLVAVQSGVEWRNAKIAVLRGASFKDPSDFSRPLWRLKDNARTLELSSFHLNSSTISDFVDILDQFRPDLLWVYPSALEGLVKLWPKGRSLTSLKAIFASSETFSSELRAYTRDVFGIDVIDFYGQAERVCASYSFDGEYHYFIPIYGRVELEHHSDNDGESYYELIGTSFWNSAMPLVKYRTGDLIRLRKGLSEEDIERVCYGLDPFLGVVGRESDYLIAPDGSRLIAMNHIPWGVEGIVQMQIIQCSIDSILINVIPANHFSSIDQDRIIENARKKIPTTMNIQVGKVNKLYRTPLGKVPYIVRKI